MSFEDNPGQADMTERYPDGTYETEDFDEENSVSFQLEAEKILNNYGDITAKIVTDAIEGNVISKIDADKLDKDFILKLTQLHLKEQKELLEGLREQLHVDIVSLNGGVRIYTSDRKRDAKFNKQNDLHMARQNGTLDGFSEQYKKTNKALDSRIQSINKQLGETE